LAYLLKDRGPIEALKPIGKCLGSGHVVDPEKNVVVFGKADVIGRELALDGIIGRHNATGKDESVLRGGLLLNRRRSRAGRIDEDFNFAAVTNLFTLAHADGHQATVVQFKVLNEVLANDHRPSLR